MKFKLATVVAGLALVALSSPSSAQDHNYGGGSVKDGGGPAGIPVPAPAPIPVYRADYYLRADVGIGMSDSMSTSESGLVYGVDAVGNDVTVPSSWVGDDGAWPMTFGLGVGRYWSDRFRTDVTVDWIRQQAGLIGGTMTYTNDVGEDVTVTTRDKTTREGGVFLFNAYYDLATNSRFNPYIGAGVGFALNILDRHHETDEEVCAAGCPGGPALNQYVADNKSSTLSFAAAAMVGFTYDLGRSMLLDVNYRYLHTGGADSSINVFDSTSVFKIDSTNEHQLRAGIRYNID